MISKKLTGDGCAALQHVVNVLHHDPLHVLKLRVQLIQVPPASGVQNRLFGFLDEGIELDERVGTGNGVDAGSILTLKLDH